ncbi:hypothetical protein [Brachyspira hyodysenteriae]|nr:hypothetical protein [Brachyspira hyodysenteriae]MCZ9977009.1 hypothetical protein [Brachyspira hyodysenteriae]
MDINHTKSKFHISPLAITISFISMLFVVIVLCKVFVVSPLST